jgi:predicted dehydrogenase
MKSKSLNVGLIGAGNIGSKRIRAVLDLETDKILAIYDVNTQKADLLAKTCGAKVCKSVNEIFNNPNVDCVIIATTTDASLNLTLRALGSKKNVLVEKPLGSNAKEALKVSLAAKKEKRIVKVGFNHRFHPAVAKAFELFKQGRLGKVMYIRAVYGHGARPGYDIEWRMQKKFSPGGELFDQGVHIIDMALWFLGKFVSAFAVNKNFYWKKSRLEDNSFSQLESAQGSSVSFHVSLTQWKNRFNFEVYGTKGYLLVNGLGKSYGTETLTWGTDVGQGRVPTEQIFEFIGEDISWKEEWKEFRQAALFRKQPMSSASDNVEVCKALEALYLSAKTKKIIRIKK